MYFFFNDTATTEIYTLSLHDALPIWATCASSCWSAGATRAARPTPRRPSASTDGRREKISHRDRRDHRDRKSTRLNSSHANISYAVFCLKKKKNKQRA